MKKDEEGRKKDEERRKQEREKRKQEEKRDCRGEQLPYAYWLHTVEGLGNRTRRELLEYAGSPKNVYELPSEELRSLVRQGLLTEGKRRKLEQAGERDLEEAYAGLVKTGIRFVPLFHPEYPEKLARTPDAPFALYVLGGLPDGRTPTVAVIGARECSEYGRYMAAKCGAGLARAGVRVISGMARGIDGIAQKAALEAGGQVYAVLGCGVDICYPEQNRAIYERMKAAGGVCSEYPPGTAPKAGLFPPRNRIISGLADLVLIIEAREKSGTLITADMALEQGREVYALPGRVTDALSEGCNRLLRQGAGVFTSVDELLAENGWTPDNLRCGGKYEEETEKTEEKDRKKKSQCGEERRAEKVASCLDFYPVTVADLQQKTGMEYRELVVLLFRLCMEGRARQVSADSYVLCTC